MTGSHCEALKAPCEMRGSCVFIITVVSSLLCGFSADTEVAPEVELATADISKLVSWCFEPSQPRRFTSGLTTADTESKIPVLLRGMTCQKVPPLQPFTSSRVRLWHFRLSNRCDVIRCIEFVISGLGFFIACQSLYLGQVGHYRSNLLTEQVYTENVTPLWCVCVCMCVCVCECVRVCVCVCVCMWSV